MSKLEYDEETVEKSAKIIHQNYAETSWADADYGERVWALGTARAVLHGLQPDLTEDEKWANYYKSMEGDR